MKKVEDSALLTIGLWKLKDPFRDWPARMAAKEKYSGSPELTDM